MKIDVLEKNDNNIRLIIREVDVPFMNALRRITLSEVPSMAIDEVVMIENSSILQDEVIAHRLGFIPIKTDLDSYNLPEDCPCKSEFGCNLCRVTFTLDAKVDKGIRTINSEELVSENPNIIPVSKGISITKLAGRQKLKLEAYAKLGKGKAHSKWQPVSMSVYKYFPKIDIFDNCNACKKCVDICSRKVLAKTESKIEVRNLLACTLCQDCAEVCPKNPLAIKVDWEKNTFIFSIETTGVLSPGRTLKEAVKILKKQLIAFKNQIKVKNGEED